MVIGNRETEIGIATGTRTGIGMEVVGGMTIIPERGIMKEMGMMILGVRDDIEQRGRRPRSASTNDGRDTQTVCWWVSVSDTLSTLRFCLLPL
jgi:hypothetical protein